MRAQILQQGMIKSPSDITTLHIIDFKRTNGYYNNDIFLAIDIVSKWLVDTTMYTIVELDLKQFPKRDDFPGWKHVGGHVPIGQLYWNFFQYQFGDDSPELYFADMPDFTGSFLDDNGIQRNVFGDIGEVSVSTFMLEAVPYMQAHDLWVSVINENRQVILEPQISFMEAMAMATSELAKKCDEYQTVS